MQPGASRPSRRAAGRGCRSPADSASTGRPPAPASLAAGRSVPPRPPSPDSAPRRCGSRDPARPKPESAMRIGAALRRERQRECAGDDPALLRQCRARRHDIRFLPIVQRHDTAGGATRGYAPPVQQRAELERPASPTIAEAPAQRLKILFSLLHPGYLRHYGQPIRLLAARGHEVHVALGRLEKDPGDFRLIEELAADCPTVTYSLSSARARRDGWRRLAWLVRALTDLARYGDPRFADAPALRERIADKLHWRIEYSRLPGPFKGPLHRAVDRHSSGADASLSQRTLTRLRRLEAAIP